MSRPSVGRWPLLPTANHTDPDNRYNYVYSALEATNRLESQDAVRLEHQQQHESVRPDSRATPNRSRARAARGEARPDLALPTPGVSNNRGRSYDAVHIVQVLSATMTNEILATFYPIRRQPTPTRDPSKLRLDALNVAFQGVFPHTAESVRAVQ
jgi:hypothetical protein